MFLFHSMRQNNLRKRKSRVPFLLNKKYHLESKSPGMMVTFLVTSLFQLNVFWCNRFFMRCKVKSSVSLLMFFSGWPATLKQNLHRYENLQFFHKWFVRSIIKLFPSNTATGHSDLLKSTHDLRQICKTLLVPSPLSQRWKSFVLCKSMPFNVTAMEGWGYTVYTKKCPNDTCVSL